MKPGHVRFRADPVARRDLLRDPDRLAASRTGGEHMQAEAVVFDLDGTLIDTEVV